MSTEDFNAQREYSRQCHEERVAKTPERVKYAEERFKAEGVSYRLNNPETGHLTVWDAKGCQHQFWAGTGKIAGRESRGIRNMIRIAKGGRRD